MASRFSPHSIGWIMIRHESLTGRGAMINSGRWKVSIGNFNHKHLSLLGSWMGPLDPHSCRYSKKKFARLQVLSRPKRSFLACHAIDSYVPIYDRPHCGGIAIAPARASSGQTCESGQGDRLSREQRDDYKSDKAQWNCHDSWLAEGHWSGLWR